MGSIKKSNPQQAFFSAFGLLTTSNFAQLCRTIAHRPIDRSARQMDLPIIRDSFGPGEQQGAVVPILAVVVIAVFIIMAFVIDIPTEEVIIRQVQEACDAAALAAAGELDGTKAGFSNAKKAAVATLRQNKIQAATDNFADNTGFALSSGTIFNAAADGTVYAGTSGSSGNLEVTIERGLYWSKEDGSGYEFISLETATSGKKFGLPLYLFANAAQVSLKISGVDTTFAKIFGIGKFDQITRTAKAVNDSEVEREVAPFAVRACDLMLDINPNNASGDHFTENFSAESQCKRNSILFREPNWENAATDNVNVTPPYDVSGLPNTVGTIRREGFWRALSFRRPALYQKTGAEADLCFPSGTAPGTYPNCKNLPPQGVLGIPGATYEKSDYSEFLRSLSGTPILAKIGQKFRSLEDPQPLWDQTRRDGAGHTSNELLAAWINSGSQLLRAALYNGGTPKPNFPWLNTRGPDSNRNLYTRRFWPDPANEHNMIPFVMDEFNSDQWTNPLCHADGIAVNNKATARTRKVWVPVLASTEKKNGQDMLYCDWAKTFTSAVPSSVPVLSVSKPRVIGYLPVQVIDGNFANLDLQFPPPDSLHRATPVAIDPTDASKKVIDQDPAKLEMNSDKLPALKALKEKIKDFREQHDDYFNCVEDHGDDGDDCSSHAPGNPDIMSLFDQTAWYARCFQFFEGSNRVFGANGAYATAFAEYSQLSHHYLEAKEECDDDPESPSCETVYRWDSKAEREFRDFFKNIDKIVDSGVPAIPDVHCLPVPKPNKYDLGDNESWEPMNPRAAGVGCGGITAVLDQCAAGMNLSTGKTKAESKPALARLPNVSLDRRI